ARVELEDSRAVVGEHQAREETADERRPAAREFVDDGLMDARYEVCRRVEPPHRRVGAHPTGVRPEVAVRGALEVLRRAEGDRARSVAEREEGSLPSLEQLLDHDWSAERGRLE